MGQRVYIMMTTALFGLASCGPTNEASKPAPEKADEASGEAQTAAPKDGAKTKELERLRQEAAAAVDEKDWPQARQSVKAGLALIGEGAGFEVEKAELLRLLGDAERETGAEMAARRHYTDAMALFHVQKNDPGRFETLLSKTLLEARRGDYSAADRELSQAEEFLAKLKERKYIAQYKIIEGRLASRKVDHQAAYDAIMEAIRIFEANKDHASRADALLLLAAEEDKLGMLPASRRSLNKALSLFEEQEDLDGKVRALHRLATYAEREKKYAKARKLLGQVEALYDQLDRQSDAANVRLHLNALPVPEKKDKK